jgi:hypothetical protein
VLVAARLTADPRSAGRAAAVLALAGLAFGIQGGFAAVIPIRTVRRSTSSASGWPAR